MRALCDDVNLTSHDWLITCPSFSTFENDLAESEPLKEFVCPPLVFPRRSSRRYSRIMNSMYMGEVIGEWERKLIFSKLKHNSPVVEHDFQRRLCEVHKRNSATYVRGRQLTAALNEAEKQEKRILKYNQRGERMADIFARHRNLVNILRQEAQVRRARQWYTIVLSHVFLTALIKERRVHEAYERISWMLVPIVVRRAAVRRRRIEAEKLTKKNLVNIPSLSPTVIRSMQGVFFNGWPSHLLERLAEKARPIFLTAGSFLMHEGDLDRCMYMITLGFVKVIINDPTRGKKRTVECSKASFSLTPPCYVGEFALVCKEPRTASIQCETDVGAWIVSPEDYDEVAQRLSSEIASKQRDATDVRRRANLQRFFPLSVELLSQFPYFEKFSTAALTKIISGVEPLVLHDGDPLFSKSDIDTSAYFIQDGTAILINEDGTRRTVPRGSCVGIFECACGVNERKKCTIISKNYCDIWRMSRDVLLDVGMSEPAAFLYCRSAAKSNRAAVIVRPAHAPLSLRKDPYILFSLTRQLIARLWEMSVSVIYLNDEKLVIQGQPFKQFIILHNGVFETKFFSSSGEHQNVRITVKNDQFTVDVLSGVSAANASSMDVSPKAQFFSLVLGAYEYASSSLQYCSTVTSYGLSEAFVVDLAQFDAIVPFELKSIIEKDKKGREYIYKCYKENDPDVLTTHMTSSFSSIYRKNREC